MAGERLLVVEDDPAQRELVARALRHEGHQVRAVGSAEEALEQLDGIALLICDWKLPGMDGLALLRLLRDRGPDPAVIVVTAYGTIAQAVAAIQAGADDYLPKPFERSALVLAVARTLKARHLEAENRRLTEALGTRDRLVDLVGSTPAMAAVFRRVEKVASTHATVLITGESGTGKELAARALHALSDRRGGPFVPLNCAAIPEALLESELFGAEQGAFTGATRRRRGQLEAAHGGTLFLDEIGELPLSAQPKLLRALQERSFTRVGGTHPISVDLRVMAATNRNLLEEVAAGRFREDLYYRLAVVPIRMPALRERREDIPRLIEHFAEAAARRHELPPVRFGSPALRALMDRPWPGNVRELSNVVERLVLLAEDGEIRLDELPPVARATPDAFRIPPGGMSWASHERSCLAQALELAGGNRARAARLLDLSYKAFLYRLDKHGLAPGR